MALNKKLRQLEGKNSVLEALRAGKEFASIWVSPTTKLDDRVKEILHLAKKRHIRIERKKPNYLNRFTKTGHSQNIIGLVYKSEIVSLKSVLASDDYDTLVVLVDGLEYETNLGALIRSADCAGASAVVVSSGSNVKIESEVVSKSSVGASEHLPVFKTSLFPVLKQLQENAFRIIGVEIGGGKKYFEEDLTGRVALVIGGEHKGLSDTIQNKCDSMIEIPMKGHINSLNVSTSGAIVMFERLRQLTK